MTKLLSISMQSLSVGLEALFAAQKTFPHPGPAGLPANEAAGFPEYGFVMDGTICRVLGCTFRIDGMFGADRTVDSEGVCSAPSSTATVSLLPGCLWPEVVLMAGAAGWLRIVGPIAAGMDVLGCVMPTF
jgi:hypothetical protein